MSIAPGGRRLAPALLRALLLACLAAPVAGPHRALAASTGDSLADLPIESVRSDSSVTAHGEHAETVAVLLTGDGGWAQFDRALAARLASRGVPVSALNSLKYFWRPRTPEGAAADLARIMRHALDGERRQRVLLIGYSFGADVLPFLVNRLPPDLLARVASVHLLALSPRADFEIHPADWWRHPPDGRGAPVVPEIARMPKQLPSQCYYGRGEDDDPCPALPSTIGRVEIGAGHHFSDDTLSLATAILQVPAGDSSR